MKPASAQPVLSSDVGRAFAVVRSWLPYASAMRKVRFGQIFCSDLSDNAASLKFCISKCPLPSSGTFECFDLL